MAKRGPARTSADDTATHHTTDRRWRARFIDYLAISSNVSRSAEHAGIDASRAYRLRRADPDFARQWQVALAEGYSHLEMEVLRRLREGDFKTGDGEKFDFANAIRLLAAHRDSAANGQSRERDVSAEEVRASIDSKIEEIRRRMIKAKPGDTQT